MRYEFRGGRFAVGLGSNLGDRLANLRLGLGALAGHAEELQVSGVFETEPKHLEAQGHFLNACCTGRTRLTPRQLLSVLQDAQRAAGRRSGGTRYGPRELDLDLLLYGDTVLDDPQLTLPHPRLHERGFVLVPLAELTPEWVVPGTGPGGGRTIRELAERAGSSGVTRTEHTIEIP